MRQFILAFELSVVLIATFAVLSAEAATVTATFYYHGIDLDTTVPLVPDPNVVIVLHGSQGSVPAQFFKPAGYEPQFDQTVEIYFEYDSTIIPDCPSAMTLNFPATQTRLNVMSRELSSTPYADVDATRTASILFEPLSPICLTTNPGPTIILQATDGREIKVGNFVQSGFAMQCDFEYLVPEINVKQGTTNIPTGGSYPFGTVSLGSNTSKVFTIENTGTAYLALNGTTKVAISGAHASNFSVTVQPTSPVTPKGAATFTLRFAPTATGTRTATVSIANNDSNENPYTFTVTGTGQTAGNSYLLWTK